MNNKTENVDSERAALLPCPFCGGPVNLELVKVDGTAMYGRREWWGVICRNTENRGGTCAVQQIPSASKEAAVARWNRRMSASIGEDGLPELPKALDKVAIHVRICDELPHPTKEGSAESWEDYYTADHYASFRQIVE